MEFRRVSEVYRSLMLTVIEVLLAVIAVRMPRSVTWNELAAGRAGGDKIPFVRIDGGTADLKSPMEVKVVGGLLDVKVVRNPATPLDVWVVNQALGRQMMDRVTSR